MNRRRFLTTLAAAPAAAVLPKVAPVAPVFSMQVGTVARGLFEQGITMIPVKAPGGATTWIPLYL